MKTNFSIFKLLFTGLSPDPKELFLPTTGTIHTRLLADSQIRVETTD